MKHLMFSSILRICLYKHKNNNVIQYNCIYQQNSIPHLSQNIMKPKNTHTKNDIFQMFELMFITVIKIDFSDHDLFTDYIQGYA